MKHHCRCAEVCLLQYQWTQIQRSLLVEFNMLNVVHSFKTGPKAEKKGGTASHPMPILDFFVFLKCSFMFSNVETFTVRITYAEF